MNLPNKLTLFRVILIPFFVFFLLAPYFEGYGNYIAVAIFIVASITDFLDGKIARKYNLEPELMEKLIVSVDKNKHYTRSNVIKKEVTRIINQEWLHQDSLPEEEA